MTDYASVAAIVIGFFTFLVILVPLGLSPWWPFALCVVGFTLTFLDSALNQGRYGQLFLDVAQEKLDTQYRQRLAYHESGHLLVGYVLGLKPIAYAVGAWVCYQSGYPASSVVEFDQPEQVSLRAYGVTLMAGGVAEVIGYEKAKGGADDLAKVRELLTGNPRRVELEREYVREATRILKAHAATHSQLAQLMAVNAPLAACLQVLNREIISPP